MREVPEALRARIESGAARLCHVWIVTRRDEERLGFTDHDRPLEVDGVVCRAATGWTAGAWEGGDGAGGREAAISGVLDDDRLTIDTIEAGALDGAAVEWRRVDWSEPALGVVLWTGTLGRIVRAGEGFTAELEGPLAALDRVAGRTYGRDCDAMLGDARCGVDVSAFPGIGCDRRWDTCRTVFDNGVNFRGFPDIPGDDFLTAVPVEGRRHDGGSRR